MSPGLLLLTISTHIAAAGGGGSSSGSGDGGSIIALLGYFPSYYLGKLIKKFLPRKAELAVSIAGASLVSLALLSLTLSMGGGELFMVLVVAGIWAGWYAAFFNAFDKLHKRFKQSEAVIATASQTDGIWNGGAIEQHARTIFSRFEADWSTFNTNSIASYTTQRYTTHTYLLLACLKQLRRSNEVENPKVLRIGIMDVIDSPDNTQDRFTAAIEWQAKDRAIETATGRVLWANDRSVIEYWHFSRQENSWLLDGISQDTVAPWLSHDGLAQFAASNDMFYSPDMGALFLPYAGVLFNQKNQNAKDINNHVVGVHNQRLVQFYTFSYAAQGNNQKDYYLVAQIQLPKSYGGILVESASSSRGKRLFGLIKNSVPKGYEQHSLEWPDFHNRYRVYATDADRLATFELMNPGFMAYLYDNDPRASIEVANNIVYLYKPVESSNATDYEKFLTIMLRAFKELQL